MEPVPWFPNFRVLHELTRHAHSRTFIGESLTQGSLCVLKSYELDAPDASPAQIRRNPELEIAFLSSCLHPNISRLIEFGRLPESRQLFIALEHAPGIPLNVASLTASREQLLALLIQ